MSEKKVKLSIKGGVKSKPTIPELELFLEQDNDSVDIRICDAEGIEWALLSILPDGKFMRMSVVSDLGLRLNKNGQILEAKQHE